MVGAAGVAAHGERIRERAQERVHEVGKRLREEVVPAEGRRPKEPLAARGEPVVWKEVKSRKKPPFAVAAPETRR